MLCCSSVSVCDIIAVGNDYVCIALLALVFTSRQDIGKTLEVLETQVRSTAEQERRLEIKCCACV
jgi:hypothetical protein